MIFKNLFRHKRPPETASLTIVVGLGNPGQQYEQTRHNVGFLAVDILQQKLRFSEFQAEKKFQAMVSKGIHHGQKVALVKPLTFMNVSGQSVATLLNFHKCSPSELIVIHDDIDLPSGTIKTTLSSSSAGHNGVQNIIEMLGTQNFKRIRVGIGRPEKKDGECLPIHEYVLQRFTKEEEVWLKEIFESLHTTLENLIGEKPSTLD